MTGATQPGRNGGTLRRGGPGRPKGLPAEFFEFFEKGDPKSGLPPRKERFLTLLTCEDMQVRIRVEQLLLEHQHGKPVQAVEHSGAVATFAIETPHAVDRDAWLASNAESARQIAAAEAGEEVN